MEKEKDLYSFEFYPADDDSTSITLSFNATALCCAELHKMCKTFALALGYQPETVNLYFGENNYDWLN